MGARRLHQAPGGVGHVAVGARAAARARGVPCVMGQGRVIGELRVALQAGLIGPHVWSERDVLPLLGGLGGPGAVTGEAVGGVARARARSPARDPRGCNRASAGGRCALVRRPGPFRRTRSGSGRSPAKAADLLSPPAAQPPWRTKLASRSSPGRYGLPNSCARSNCLGSSAWTEWHWAQTWADAFASSRVGWTMESSAESEKWCR